MLRMCKNLKSIFNNYYNLDKNKLGCDILAFEFSDTHKVLFDSINQKKLLGMCDNLYLVLFEKVGPWRQARSSRGARRCPPRWLRSVREASRGHEEQVLAGEPQVDDRHGRGGRHCLGLVVLEVFHGHPTTAATLLHATASTPTPTSSACKQRCGR